MNRLLCLLLPVTLAACSQQPTENAALPKGSWQLVPEQSNLAFVSVKAGNVGEAHSFKTFDGAVTEDGKASVTIDLASVDTAVDIRNERMREMLFQVTDFPDAKLSATIDPKMFDALAIGERTVIDLPVTLDLHGVSSSLDAKLAVTRISADKVEVATVSPLIVDAAAFKLDGGIEQLRAIAKLPAISTAVPVTASLVFDNVG